ncbi:MAG: chemotaxis protein CheB [Sulfurimonas sp.]|nr:chemotaxis protein CheB [Sulfurimonas sp.]
MKLSVPKKIVLIGASTGGPGQIQKIIDSLPKLQDITIVIAQHMVDGFMDSFANRFQDIKHLSVSVVENNQSFENNNIYICQGETQLINENFSKKDTSLNSYNPNINILFNSFTSLAKDTKIICVILTGIGDDGVEACKNLSNNGALCITESKKSAIVDGMPSRARLLVPNIIVHDIDRIVQIISEFCE